MKSNFLILKLNRQIILNNFKTPLRTYVRVRKMLQ